MFELLKELLIDWFTKVLLLLIVLKRKVQKRKKCLNDKGRMLRCASLQYCSLIVSCDKFIFSIRLIDLLKQLISRSLLYLFD